MLKILYISVFLLLPDLNRGISLGDPGKTRPEILQAPCGIQIGTEVKHATEGSSNGEIKLTISGGVAPYQIFWIGNVPSKYMNNKKIEGLNTGFYSVVVVDKNRCSETLMNIKVDLNPDR